MVIFKKTLVVVILRRNQLEKDVIISTPSPVSLDSFQWDSYLYLTASPGVIHLCMGKELVKEEYPWPTFQMMGLSRESIIQKEEFQDPKYPPILKLSHHWWFGAGQIKIWFLKYLVQNVVHLQWTRHNTQERKDEQRPFPFHWEASV